MPNNDFKKVPDNRLRDIDLKKIDTIKQKEVVVTSRAQFVKNLSPHLKAEMENLLKEEKKIQNLLVQPAQAELFKRDPLKFFKEAKIELNPILIRKFETFNFEKELKKEKFLLPNGQLINPNVKINIK